MHLLSHSKRLRGAEKWTSVSPWRVVSVLEGGYGYLGGNDGAASLVREGLAACVVGHVRALAGLVPPPPPPSDSS